MSDFQLAYYIINIIINHKEIRCKKKHLMPTLNNFYIHSNNSYVHLYT